MTTSTLIRPEHAPQYAEGRRAFADYKRATNNPYGKRDVNDRAAAWHEGFADAAVNAPSMFR